jgi:signal transduction histidine kinase
MTKSQRKLTPEMLVPRLGEALVSSGRISQEGLEKALAYQQEKTAAGQAIALGQALLDLELIDRPGMDQAVTEQIISLRSALQAANRTLDRRVHERTAELQQALERLTELGELKANFVANISHELRTPLTHIKGYLELMVTEMLGPLTDEQRHAVQVSQEGARKLEKLVEDLLTFSRGSRGEISFKQEAVDVRQLAERAVSNVEAGAREHGIEVRVSAADELPLVHADGEQILWALTQLLDNAVKFTLPGGHAVVGLSKESPNLVMVSVSDTGVGIPAARLEEIFEPFHQLDSSASRRRSGAGLGLTLVRQIVEAHGSVLSVASLEGKGTTFKFPLLVAAEAAARVPARDE